jgi:hypothetical protein
LWLPIGILYGVEWRCEYTSSALLLNWMDGGIYRLYGPNWPPNSMPSNLFWTIGILGFNCDWFINALTTLCNSTCSVAYSYVKRHRGTIHDSMSFFIEYTNSWK